MNDEPEQPPANTAQESLDGIVQATQAHANGVIESINGTLAPVQTRASEVIDSINGTLTPVQTNMNEAIQSISGILPPVQTHANEIVESISGTLPPVQTRANEVIESISGTLPPVQTRASEVIESINGILTTVQEHANGIMGHLDEIIPVTQEHVDNLTKEIKSYHKKLLIDEKDDEGNPVNSIKTENENYIKDQKGNFNQLRKDLEEEIRALLPEAGAAGLSSAYFEAKTRYGAVPYKRPTDEEKIDEKNTDKKTDDKKNTDKKTDDETTLCIPNAFWHFIGTNTKGVMFYTLFILPLAVIIYLMVSNNITGLIDIVNKDGTLNFNALLRRFFISSPFAMLSWFGWGSIRLNRRLYEEYNHKQRVMQLYHSFKKEIGEHGTEEQKQELLDIMLKNVADKPSLAVHSGKKKYEQISLFKGWFILARGSEKLSEPKPVQPEPKTAPSEPKPVSSEGN